MQSWSSNLIPRSNQTTGTRRVKAWNQRNDDTRRKKSTTGRKDPNTGNRFEKERNEAKRIKIRRKERLENSSRGQKVKKNLQSLPKQETSVPG